MIRATIISFICLFPALLSGADTLFVSEDFNYRVLGSELSYYNDESARLDLHDLPFSKFIDIGEPRPNLGFSSGAVWVMATVTNRSENERFRFQIHQPLLDTVDLYILGAHGEVLDQSQFGEAFPFDHREYDTPYFVKDHDIPRGDTHRFLIRVSTAEQIVLPVYLATVEGSKEIAQSTNLLFGAYFGLIIVMAFYNLFIYFTVRDRSYLLYVFYILAVGSTQAVLEGYFHQYLWPNNPWLASRSVYLFTALVSTSSIVFLQDFLRTAKYSPGINRIAKFIYAYFIIIVGVVLFDVNTFVHIGSQLGITVVSFYILTAGIVVYRNGYSPAKFFIIAWAVLVVGIIIYALKDAGILPSTPVTNYMMQFGSAVEALLLSLALADRINILKKEKSESQARALEVSKENERIVREQNIILEEKVTERTKDLKSANDKLSTAIGELKETQSQLVQAEKMASLGQLTAGIAHEINNPINFVSANIEPLRYDVKDILEVLDLYDAISSSSEFETKKEAIEKFKEEIDLKYSLQEVDQLLKGIEDGAKRTADIVSALKTFSRIDESSLKETDLNEGLRSTLAILKNEIGNNVSIEFELDQELPAVECFGGKINQVFLNVMNNALQAMEDNPSDRQSVLKIRSSAVGEDVEISIIDNGSGMSDDVKSRIFEPFFTTKDVGKGTGLGLSIVFKIIETHGGEIIVETEEGKGTAFKIRIPVVAKIKTEVEI